MPTKVYFGRESLLKVPRILKTKKELKKGLLINGFHLSNDSYFSKFLLDLSKFIKVAQYSFKISKSNFSSINKLTNFCRYRELDFILAVGGGTILDTAKCAAILSTNKGKIEDYVKTKKQVLQNNGLFFVAIPTTAGTGSEVSPWATVWGDDYKKYSLSSSRFMFPDISFIDPALTDLLPPYETATSGIDALCQAIESYWNVNHNSISDKYSLKAIRIISSNLERSVNKPNKEFRNKMARGSLLSGLAFSNTQTTICHAVSYPISIHWKVAHGQAVSLTLPVFFEYIVPALSIIRQRKLLEAIGSKTISEAADKIRKLMINIGLKTSFKELNINKKDIDIIVKEGFHPDRMKNSPLVPSFKELKYLLETIL